MDIFLIMKIVSLHNGYTAGVRRNSSALDMCCLLYCPVLQNVTLDILKTALWDRNITLDNLIGESGVIYMIYLRETVIF